MRLQYKILLLTLLAVVVYLPGVKAGYFVFDDSDIIFKFQDKQQAFLDFFVGDAGTYWRPLFYATYWFDAVVWDFDSSMMHLESILLHALNTLLVYASAHVILGEDRHDIPLLIAALFSLHPINTEAVNWISGRTDPLATLFCLAGLYFLFRWQKDNTKVLNCYIAGACFFIGCLAKEVAFGMFVGAALFCLVNLLRSGSRRPGHRVILHTLLPFLLFPLLYAKTRALVFSASDHGIEKVVGKTLGAPLLPQIQDALISLGFYTKKLFVPTPLAFAIDKVSGAYLWMGLATLLAALFVLLFKPRHAAMYLMVLASITPALLHAVQPLSWTTYAERYLYLPAALLALAICPMLRTLSDKRGACTLLLGILLIYYLPVTLQRNLLWAHQEDYLDLAVAQAPDNVILRNNYGVVLATFGNLDEARRQFDIAGALDPSNELVRANQQKYRPSTTSLIPTTPK